MRRTDDIVCTEGTFYAFNTTFPIPDADITGIGVIVAFSAAAYISFFISIIFYLLGCVPRERLGNFEKQIIRRQPRIQLIEAFQEGVLVVSEQQLVTALGVLGAALRHMQQYTVFEFQTVIYLAWMATNMHLSTLSILRAWFQKRPRLRAFRLFNMLALLVMMCIAIYPTTEYDWADHTVYDLGFCSNSHSCWGLTEKVDLHWNAARIHHRLVPQGVSAYAILIISHLWQSAMLFPTIHDFIRSRAHKLLDVFHRSLLQSRPIAASEISLKQIKYRFILGVYLFVLAIIEIFGSWAFIQFLVGTHLAWSSFQLFVPRFNLLPSCIATELNKWNFGQILPMLLLISPLYSLITYYLRHFHSGPSRPPSGDEGSIINSTRSGAASGDGDGNTSNSAQKTLDELLFSTLAFRFISSLLCILCVLGIAGYFASAASALLTHNSTAWRSQKWNEISWRLWPDIIATFISLVVIFLLSLVFASLSSQCHESNEQDV